MWHFDKVCKISKVCLYTLQDNLEQYNDPSKPFYCSSILPSALSFFFFVVLVALTNHRTVGQNTVQPLDSLTQHYPNFGKLGIWLSDNWTAEKSTVRTLDCWTLSSQAIGQLNTALTIHWTVRHNTVQILDSLTKHCPKNFQLLACWTQHCLIVCITSCPKIGK